MTLAQAVAYGRRWAAIRGSYSPNRSGLSKAIARGRLKATQVVSLGQSLPIWMVSESDLLDYLVSRRHDLRPGRTPERERVQRPERGERVLIETAHDA
jgi:hypothetical protein